MKGRYIALARTVRELEKCYPVMVQLRPHLSLEGFLDRVRSQGAAGYRVAFMVDGEDVVAVAGFRELEMLSRGRFLYVDDLVTHEDSRSRGYGSELLQWLLDRAHDSGLASVELDSGLQRGEAHRFYDREGFSRAGYHFSKPAADE